MAGTATISNAYVQILPSFKGGKRSITQQMNGPMSAAGSEGGKKFGGGMVASAKKFVAPLAALFAVGAGAAFFKGAIAGASDLGESQSKVAVVFGKASAQITKASLTSATAMGLSKTAYLDATGGLGNLLVSLKIAPKAAADMSQQMVTLAGDLASFNNVAPEEALAALKSGLTGETEPLKKFGVNMNDATLKAQALKLGLIKTTKEAMSPQTKALAAQALIMDQTTTAQGDFARTSGGLANQQRILAAQTDDLKTKFGSVFLPVVTRVVTFLNKNMLPAFDSIKGVVGKVATAFKDGWSADTSSSKGIFRFIAVVGNAVGAFVTWFTDVALPFAKKIAPAFLDGFSGDTSSSKGFLRVVAQIGDAVGAVVTWFKDEGIPGVEALVAAFKAGGTDITSSGFAGVMELIGITARGVYDFFKKTLIPGVGALVAAFKAGGSDITSSGFAGIMEGVGLKARVISDWIKDTGLPALGDLVDWILDTGVPAFTDLRDWFDKNWDAIKAVATLITITLVPAFAVAATKATASAVTQVAAWVSAQTASVTSAATQVLSSYAVMGGWAKSAVAATVNGAIVISIWVLLAADSIKNAAISVAAMITMDVQWLISAGKAAIGGAAQAAAWVVAQVASIKGAAIAVGSMILMDVQWVISAVKAAIGGAAQAAAWVVAQVASVKGAAIAVAAMVTQDVQWGKSTVVASGASAKIATSYAATGTAATGAATVTATAMTGVAASTKSGVASSIGSLGLLGFGIWTLTEEWEYAGNHVANIWGAMKTGWKAVVDYIDSLSWVESLPSDADVAGYFTGAGDWLVDAGESIMDGFLLGLRFKYEEVKTFISGIAGWIKEHKGPLSYDQKLLIPAGNALMDGLTTGLKEGQGPVSGQLGGTSANLIAFGRQLQAMKFSVTEHPAFGGVRGRHMVGSKHYQGKAVDVNKGAGTSIAEQRAIDAIIPLSLKYKLKNIWRKLNHFNHAHFEYDSGGYLQPGAIGVNNLRRPERVLTPSNTQSFDNLVAMLEKGQGFGGGVPSMMTLVDESGALLGRMRVIAGAAVGAVQREARDVASRDGLHSLALGV